MHCSPDGSVTVESGTCDSEVSSCDTTCWYIPPGFHDSAYTNGMSSDEWVEQDEKIGALVGAVSFVALLCDRSTS